MCEVLRTETEVECKIYSEDSQIIENYPTIWAWTLSITVDLDDVQNRKHDLLSELKMNVS